MTSLDPPLGHQQEVDWTPIEGKPEPTWVSLTFRGGKDDARLELWTDAPIKDGDEGWKAITFDGDSVVLMCPAEVSFEYTYRAIHPDGGIEWLGNESCNGRVTVRRGRALPKIEGTVTSAISAAQDTTLPGWQRSSIGAIHYFERPPFAVFHDHAPATIPTFGAVLDRAPGISGSLPIEMPISGSLLLKFNSCGTSLTVSTQDGKEILTYQPPIQEHPASESEFPARVYEQKEAAASSTEELFKWRVPADDAELWVAFPDHKPERVTAPFAKEGGSVLVLLLWAFRAWWQRLFAALLGGASSENGGNGENGENGENGAASTERTPLLNGHVSHSCAPCRRLLTRHQSNDHLLHLTFPDDASGMESDSPTILVSGPVELLQLEVRQDDEWQEIDIKHEGEHTNGMHICECFGDLSGSTIRIQSIKQEMSS